MLRLPPAAHRRSLAHDHVRRHGRRRRQGLLRHGRESRRGLDERRLSARGHAQARLAGGARLPSHRDRRVLEGRAEPRRDRQTPKSSSSPPPPTPRRTAASPTRNGCCNGITKPSSRRAIAAASLHFIYRPRPAPASDSTRLEPIRRTGPFDITWDYPIDGRIEEPTPKPSCARSTATTVADRRAVPDYARLKDDGSTACGCWIYSGCYTDGVNQTARRKPRQEQNWVAPEWGWAWPANRRILYNRASADPEGKPWSERKKYVWWDEAQKRVDRRRRARLHQGSPAVVPPARGRQGHRHHQRHRSVHHAIATARPGSSRRRDSRTDRCPRTTSRRNRSAQNPLYGQQCNPSAHGVDPSRESVPPRLGRPGVPVCADHLPAHRAPHRGRHVALARRGSPSCSPRCSAKSRRSSPRKRVCRTAAGPRYRTARAEIEARVLVTGRMQPLRIRGTNRAPDRIAVSLGPAGPVRGDSANELDFVRRRPERLHPGIESVHRQYRAGPPEEARSPCRIRPSRMARPPRRPPQSPRQTRSNHGQEHDGRGDLTRQCPPDSSPTPRSASAAKPAKSPANNGTSSPTTASSSAACPTTTPLALGASTWRHVAFVEQPTGSAGTSPG